VQLGPIVIGRRPPPVVHVVPAPSPSGDLFALVAAVTAWRDARQAVLDLDKRPLTREGRLARMALWSRYSKAEAALMGLARKLGGGQAA
jgi:hypothetical protein